MHTLGCSLMNSTQQNVLAMRWLHVLTSVCIHIDVLECLDSKIGGNWYQPLRLLRDIRNLLSSEFNINMGHINRLAEQVSMQRLANPNNGAGQSGRHGKFDFGLLSSGWCHTSKAQK